LRCRAWRTHGRTHQRNGFRERDWEDPRGRGKIHNTNPLERLDGEIKRRTDVVGVFPNEAAIIRLVGSILFAQNDEWGVQRRSMTLETLGSVGDTATVSLPVVAA
jgi:transposase-like protein